jgi:hypothetical protein
MVTRRVARISKHVGHLDLFVVASPPPPLSHASSSIHNALVDPHRRRTMEEEYEALMSNNTWDLVPHPFGVNVVTKSGSSSISSNWMAP